MQLDAWQESETFRSIFHFNWPKVGTCCTIKKSMATQKKVDCRDFPNTIRTAVNQALHPKPSVGTGAKASEGHGRLLASTPGYFCLGPVGLDSFRLRVRLTKRVFWRPKSEAYHDNLIYRISSILMAGLWIWDAGFRVRFAQLFLRFFEATKPSGKARQQRQ